MIPVPNSYSTGEEHEAADAGTVIRNLVHELRQPLSALESIVFYLDLMVTDEDPKTRKQLRRLRQLVQRSDWTLSNAVLTAGAAPLTLNALCVADVVSECATAWAAENNAQVGLVRPDQDRLQLIDEDHIRLLMRNILSFIRKGASASIVVATNAGVTEVLVEAEEMTLPEADSLAISAMRRIAALHKGSVRIEDGEAKRIRVQLPLRY